MAARPDEDVDDDPSALPDLGAYIRHQRESAKLSLRKLSKLAGVSNPYLSQIERGLRKPSAEILQAIARALEISSETLYVKAGILEEREGEGDLESAIARDGHLTDEQRQTLLRMYRTFRQLNAVQIEATAAAVAAQAASTPDDRGTLERVVDAIIPGRGPAEGGGGQAAPEGEGDPGLDGVPDEATSSSDAARAALDTDDASDGDDDEPIAAVGGPAA